ncbi:MAG TPA: cupin domain-containing protein [Mucilaginibacter sp.]|jgi:lysine-specific demethylase/histidyl-hydroxylase NO66|nr:cupin domain-containing protein [Mucilaginibacter sp.]
MGVLDYLIGDVGRDDFFDKYWTKKELFSKSTVETENLYGLNAFNKTLYFSQHHLSYPTVRLIKNGKVLPEARFVDNDKTQGNLAKKISLTKIRDLCENGATLILSGLNNYSQEISDFCNQLSSEVKETVQINAYLTQKNTQGFEAHYDHHEIFIIQILGEKDWSIYGDAGNYPLPAQQYYDQGKPDKNDQRFYKMTPGDVLYLPRGLWHEAKAVDSSSFHLTVNIKCTLKVDFLKWFIEQLAVNDKELRLNLYKTPDHANCEVFDFMTDYLNNKIINPEWINKFQDNKLNETIVDLPFKT